MSELQTYDRLSVIHSDSPTSNGSDRPLKPGDFVRLVACDDCFGTLIHVDDWKATVLWSRHPLVIDVGTYSTGTLFAPYVPLQVTPTIFANTGSFIGIGRGYGAKPSPKQNFFVTGSIK